MGAMAVFRVLLVVSIIADLTAWTWRDLAYTRALEPALAKGDTALLTTAAVFVLFAIPFWRGWRHTGVVMAALTVLAVIGRLTKPVTPYTTTDGVMILEIIAATAWGAMLAIVFLPETAKRFNRPLF